MPNRPKAGQRSGGSNRGFSALLSALSQPTYSKDPTTGQLSVDKPGGFRSFATFGGANLEAGQAQNALMVDQANFDRTQAANKEAEGRRNAFQLERDAAENQRAKEMVDYGSTSRVNEEEQKAEQARARQVALENERLGREGDVTNAITSGGYYPGKGNNPIDVARNLEIATKVFPQLLANTTTQRQLLTAQSPQGQSDIANRWTAEQRQPVLANKTTELANEGAQQGIEIRKPDVMKARITGDLLSGAGRIPYENSVLANMIQPVIANETSAWNLENNQREANSFRRRFSLNSAEGPGGTMFTSDEAPSPDNVLSASPGHFIPASRTIDANGKPLEIPAQSIAPKLFSSRKIGNINSLLTNPSGMSLSQPIMGSSPAYNARMSGVPLPQVGPVPGPTTLPQVGNTPAPVVPLQNQRVNNAVFPTLGRGLLNLLNKGGEYVGDAAASVTGPTMNRAVGAPLGFVYDKLFADEGLNYGSLDQTQSAESSVAPNQDQVMNRIVPSVRTKPQTSLLSQQPVGINVPELFTNVTPYLPQPEQRIIDPSYERWLEEVRKRERAKLGYK